MSTLEEKDAEIVRLKAELEAARKRQSEMADMAKVGELAANMAHEIRNPLAGISSLAEVLRTRIANTPDNNEIIDTILEEVDRLNRIIKDLLRFARPAKAYLVPTNLSDSLNQVLSFLGERLTEGRFKVETDVSPACPMVMADMDQIRQVCLNILINAMDATGPGGILKIRLWQPEGEKALKISFSDNGPGIPPENLQKVFDPFFTTKAQGTGLGLAACRKIIEHHRGSIWAESPPDQGATFFIQLPLAEMTNA